MAQFDLPLAQLQQYRPDREEAPDFDAFWADTLAEAHRWAREAVEALAPLPKGPIKTALTRFADSIVERSS